ncbi:hypothetical protein ACFQ2B_33075 [Streptomyces stramineus]
MRGDAEQRPDVVFRRADVLVGLGVRVRGGGVRGSPRAWAASAAWSWSAVTA